MWSLFVFPLPRKGLHFLLCVCRLLSSSRYSLCRDIDELNSVWACKPKPIHLLNEFLDTIWPTNLKFTLSTLILYPRDILTTFFTHPPKESHTFSHASETHTHTKNTLAKIAHTINSTTTNALLQRTTRANHAGSRNAHVTL